MRTQISYFDPRCPELEVVDGQNMTVITNNQDECDAIMASITDPERGITNITEEELPPLPHKLTQDEIAEFVGTWLEVTGYEH